MTMVENFWDYSVWGSINLIAVLMVALFAANVLKRRVKLVKRSLIPTSVLAGLLLLGVSAIWEHFTGTILFNTNFLSVFPKHQDFSKDS